MIINDNKQFKNKHVMSNKPGEDWYWPDGIS